MKLNRFSCRNLIVDEETKNVYSDGELLELTDTEYAILLLLLKNRHQVFSQSVFMKLYGRRVFTMVQRIQ